VTSSVTAPADINLTVTPLGPSTIEIVTTLGRNQC